MSIVIFNSFLVCVILTPIVRTVAIKWNVMDLPSSDIKTHREATPYLGGFAIMLGIITSLLVYLSKGYNDAVLSWPLFLTFIALFALGTLDDVFCFSARFRLLIQAIAYVFLIETAQLYMPLSGITFIDKFVSLFWLVGITNAFNIIDIMDGLASGVAIIIASFLIILGIAGKVEPTILLSLATAGSALGFIGYNFSKKLKIFMGDGGSTLLGAILGIGALILCSRSAQPLRDFSAICILFGIPIYDTILVMILRIRKGLSPFIGSRDHFALRMVQMGFSRISTVVSAYIVTLALGLVALVMHSSSLPETVLLGVAVILFGITWGRMLSIIDVEVKK